MEKETILIFGASGGIGSTLARKLSLLDKRVILCSRNRDKTERLAKELNQPFFLCDGTVKEQVDDVVSKVAMDYGKIDGVVNCIGSFFIKPMTQTTIEEFHEVLRINLTSCFTILKSCVPKMTAEGKGSVVFLSSCAAGIGLANHEAISAAKGAIEAFVRSAAASYAQKGIRINAGAPGLVDTPLSAPITSNIATLKGSIAFHPMGRIGTAEDISSAIQWLLSIESSWMTGEVLRLDGGLVHIKTRGVLPEKQ